MSTCAHHFLGTTFCAARTSGLKHFNHFGWELAGNRRQTVENELKGLLALIEVATAGP
jgi:hypothetical protein